MTKATYGMVLLGVWFILTGATFTGNPYELRQIDPGSILWKVNPTRKEIELALFKASASMHSLQFEQYKNAFIGKQIQWRGIVNKVESYQGTPWVLLCAQCEPGKLSEFDTLMMVPPYSASGAFIRGQEVIVTAKIKDILDSQKGVMGYFGTGFKVILE